MLWYFKFSNPNIDRNDYAYERRSTFDTVDEMREQIEESLKFYWSLAPYGSYQDRRGAAADEKLADADITPSTQRFLCKHVPEQPAQAASEREEAVGDANEDGLIYGSYRAFPLRCSTQNTSLPVLVSVSIPTTGDELPPGLAFLNEKYSD